MKIKRVLTAGLTLLLINSKAFSQDKDTAEGYREPGRRYALKMLSLLGYNNISNEQ